MPIASAFRTVLHFVGIALIALVAPVVVAQTSPTDGFDPNINGNVYAVLVQPDGNILVAGKFTETRPNGATSATTRSNIARFFPDGSIDTTFNVEVNDQITAMVLQPDGQIIIGGKFTAVGGKTRNRVARLTSAGALDLTFDPNVSGSLTPEVTALALQANGDVLVGGGFISAQPNSAATATAINRIARFKSTGALDSTFNPNANGMVLAIAVEADGQILIGGAFTTLQPNGGETAIRSHVARLTVAGTVDAAFDPATDNSVNCISVQADGRILLAGSFTTLKPNEDETVSTGHARIVRLFADGSIDTSFTGTADGLVETMKIQPDGRILVGGSFSSAGNSARPYATRLLPSGIADTEFNPAPNFVVRAFAVQSNGGVILGGGFTALRGYGSTSIPRNHLARVAANGILDSDFRPDVNGRLATLAVLADGRILAAGSFTSVGGVTHNRLVRLSAAGVVDHSFAPDINGVVNTVAQQTTDGKILIGGGFTQINGIVRPYFARLSLDGTLDETFNSPTGSQVNSIAVQADNKILVGGSFTEVRPNATTEPVQRSYLARFNPDGSLDTSFNTGTSDPVMGILVQPDDAKIVLVGNFSTVQRNLEPIVTRFGVARLSADGTIDSTFDPNVNGAVRTIVRQSDGKFVLGGSFTFLKPNGSTDPVARRNIARINTDGSIDKDFDPSIGGVVTSLALAGDKILVGGSFTQLQPGATGAVIYRNYLVRLTSAGKVDEAFNLGLDSLPGNMVAALAPIGSGSILVGGAFTNSNGTKRNRLLLINSAGVLDESFDSDVGSASGAAVEVVTTQADGRILVAGTFSNLGGSVGSNLARFTPDSAPDSGFSPSVNGVVYSVAQQPSKGAAVATQHAGLAWLESNGQLRTSFAPPATLSLGTPQAFAFQDDNLLVAGSADTAGTTGTLARFLPNGTLDTSFAPKINGTIAQMYIVADKKILVAGTFSKVGETSRINVARLNSDGTLDSSYDPNPNGPVETISFQGDDKVIIGGSFSIVGPASGTTSTRSGIARLNKDGTVDSVFNPTANATVFATAVLPGGKIMVGGQFTTLQPNGATTSTPRTYVARLNEDGTLDSLDLKANGPVYVITVQSDGKILLGGAFTAIAGSTRNYLARLNSDGTLDTAFNPNPNAPVDSIVLDPSGGILIGGSFKAFDLGNSGYSGSRAIPRSYAARLKADGTIDGTFNPNFDNSVSTVFLAPDGSILAAGTFSNVQPTGSLLVGGAFTSISGLTVSNFALFSSDGSISSTFLPNPNGAVYALTPLPNGSVIMGGAFTSIAGATRNRIARFTATDALDSTFDPNINGAVYTVLVLSNGQLLVGGSFTTVGGVSRSNLVRLNTDGSVDAAFGPTIVGAVHSLALQRDGKILYTRETGTGTNSLARLNADGTADSTFNPANNGVVASIAVQADGKIVVGGSFTTIAGSSAQKYLARLGSDGVLDTTFTSTTNGPVTALSIQQDGKILLGGSFSSVDGLPRFGVARLSVRSVSTESLTAGADRTSITWTRSNGSPEIYGARFESSSDAVTWTTLGEPTRIAGTSNWQLSGLSLAATTNIYIRARGLEAVSPNGSASVVSSQTQLYLAAGTGGPTPTPTPVQPVISSATAVSGATGTSFLYAITASGQPTTYGATGLPAGLSINSTTGLITGTPTQSGTFNVVLTANNGGTPGTANLVLIVAASPAATANPPRLLNLSVNAQVTASNPIIAGFVISGSQPQNVLLRAVGPALAGLGVTNALNTPRLRLFNSANVLLLERDGWDGSADLTSAFTRLGAYPFSVGSGDAAMLVTLSPGVYSLHVTTTSTTGGIAVAEIYDASASLPPATASRLVNLSARGQVGGGRLVTGGFVIDGNSSKKVLLRGVGPALGSAGLSGALTDPAIALFKSGTSTSAPIASNSNWQLQSTLNPSYPVGSVTEVATAISGSGAFAFTSGSKDAAIVVTLPPGVYSAQVYSETGTSETGAAMVEVYEVQ